MIVDVVPFNNELDILDLRLNVLSPFVDYFVISEAPSTFSGHEKPLYFESNAALFADFADRIVHHIVPDAPAENPFERDRQQKDDIRRTLDSLCAGSDLILFSDVDELPNPDTLAEACDLAASGRMAHFAQRLFYYYVNLEEVSGRLLSITGDYPGAKPQQWLGSRMCTMEYAAPWTMTELRDPGHKATGGRVDSGGWHFSYAGSPGAGLSVDDRVRQKVLDFAHQELVDDRVMRKLPSRIARQKDVFGRRAKFRKRDLDSGFPEYLRQHPERYSHMVLP